MAGMELVDGPSVVAAPDQVPTADQEVPVASYRDWRQEDTFVVQCAIANDVYPGTRYDSRDKAQAAVSAKHGRILEANYTPGRAFFRVFKPRSS